MQNCRTILLFVWLLLTANQTGCGLDPPPRWAAMAPNGSAQIQGDRGAKADAIAADQLGPACPPVLSGELVINEVLARPAGQDLDGDGQFNQRDEALEVRLVAQGPRHLQGVALQVAGQLRGQLADATCHPAGTLLVLVGSTTAALALPAGPVQVNLSGQLALRDEGAMVTLVGRGGGILDQVSYPPGPAGRSLVRTPEGSRWAPLKTHPETGSGNGHSIGLCSDGTPADSCWPAATST